ncbi:MAG TPA: glycosyltransferase, partial [Salinimicrobium sp.]|nr:glycosyltransferase [Salinimicrobium sp.]
MKDDVEKISSSPLGRGGGEGLSLIICTFQRPVALRTLLESVKQQSLYPNQIIIVDGSLDDQTQEMLKEHHFPNLENFKVDEANRGLTKQRNF